MENELVSNLRRQIDEISKKAKALNQNPSVLCLEWLSPLMAGGCWVPEFVEMLGGKHLFGRAGEHAPWIQWENIREHDPDFLIIMSCGFSMRRNLKQMRTLPFRPGWNDLKAVREERVFAVDSNHYFSRPGPRLLDSFQILAEILYPEVFPFGYREKGWTYAFLQQGQPLTSEIIKMAPATPTSA